MPELPEVETIARSLRPKLVGGTILDSDLRWKRTLASPSAKKFKAQIRGQKITVVSRRAKYVDIHLSDYRLLIHLRMSGDLLIKNADEKNEKHDRLILTIASRRGKKIKLVFNDTRKFGRVWLAEDAESVLGKLGPEPLGADFTAEWLRHALQKKKRRVKPLLLDQTFLAGLGNIYTDEALHIAKIHPLAASDSINARQARGLWEAIRNVLKEGIRRNGASIDWVYRGGKFQHHFRVYDRAGQACPVCGTMIEKFFVGQRGTHVCPQCQAR